jgi:hypothetical protein
VASDFPAISNRSPGGRDNALHLVGGRIDGRQHGARGVLRGKLAGMIGQVRLNVGTSLPMTLMSDGMW